MFPTTYVVVVFRVEKRPSLRVCGSETSQGKRARHLEVYRKPVADGAALCGWRYGRAVSLVPGEWVAPLAAPGAAVTITHLLP